MREYFMGNKENIGFFLRKIYDLERVQIEIDDIVREEILHMGHRVATVLNDRKDQLSNDLVDAIQGRILSNLVELRLNIETIIVNFRRITGVKIVRDDFSSKKKGNLFRKGQLFFLLDRNTSKVYGKLLIYLKEEIRSEISYLKIDLDKILRKIEDQEEIDQDLDSLIDKYFRMNSELSLIIEDINSAIESIYKSVSANRNKHINLGFLLISAFLSVVLFFPEFNNMLNLREAEISYEEKMDQLIYSKALEEISCRDLINIKESTVTEEMEERIDVDLVEKIIVKNMEEENSSLEREKDRINVFLTILVMILTPYILWIIFVAI